MITVSSLGKRLVISVSQRQGVYGSVNSQQNVRFGNVGKLESPPIEQASRSCYALLLCISCVIDHDFNSEFIWISKFNKRFVHLMANLMTIRCKNIVFLCSLTCES